MRNRIKRIFMTALVTAMLVGMIPASSALAAVGTITVSQASGTPGTLIGVGATGFTPSTTYSVLWGGTTVLVQGNTGTTGNFTAQFPVPATFQRGTYGVSVTTTAPDTSNSVSFTITPVVNLNITSGGVGDQLSITGFGFLASSSVSIYFDAVVVLTTTSNTLGNITATLTIPQSQRGSHSVRAADSFGDSQIATFTVTQKLTVTPSQAAVGAPVTISGTGFGAVQTVSVFFDEVFVTSAVTDGLGSFTLANFVMPAGAFGSHILRATDATSVTQSVTVNTSQSISVSPPSGPAATKVTVTGSGFRANEAITISYENTAIGGAVTSDAKGGFTATFDVPISAGGAHPVKAADSFNADSKNFSVTPTANASPTSGFVGTRVSVTGNGYLANQTISVLFDRSLAKTVTADAQGSFSTTFDTPSKPAGKYTITVTDGVNARDFEFTVTTSAAITPQTTAASPGSVGGPVTVTGIGFSAGKRVSVTFDGKEITSGTVGNDSNFSITFEAPVAKAGQYTITVNDGTVSMPLTFVMEGNPPPAPVLLVPEIGVRAEAIPTLSWNAVADPSGVTYVLQLADNPSFSSPVLEKRGLTTTQYTLSESEKLKPTPKDGAYFWRVMAIDRASNEGPWSNAKNFLVGTPFPAWALWVLIGLGGLIILLFAFWLGRRAAVSRPVSRRLDDDGMPK